jgi:hypothetical protein
MGSLRFPTLLFTRLAEEVQVLLSSTFKELSQPPGQIAFDETGYNKHAQTSSSNGWTPKKRELYGQRTSRPLSPCSELERHQRYRPPELLASYSRRPRQVTRG